MCNRWGDACILARRSLLILREEMPALRPEWSCRGRVQHKDVGYRYGQYPHNSSTNISGVVAVEAISSSTAKLAPTPPY